MSKNFFEKKFTVLKCLRTFLDEFLDFFPSDTFFHNSTLKANKDRNSNQIQKKFLVVTKKG